MQLSLNRAKEALDALQSVTDELNDRLKAGKSKLQRRLVAIRGIMDKEKIHTLQSKLARSVDLLWKERSSRRLLAETLTRRITQTIRSEMGSGDPDLHQTHQIAAAPIRENDDIPEFRGLTLRSPPKAEAHRVFRWRLPTWWSTTIWEVCSAPLAGWKYGLRIYNIVPGNSKIFRSVRDGDMTTVMQLLRSKKASVYDQDEHGCTLLQVSRSLAQAANGGPTDLQKHAVWSQHVFHQAGRDHQYPMQLITALLTWGLHDTIHDMVWPILSSAFKSVAHQALYTPNPHPDRRELLRLLWAYHPVVEDYEADMNTSATVSDQDAPAFHHLLYHIKLGMIRIAAFDVSHISDPDPTCITQDGKVVASHVLRSLEGQDSLVHSTAVSIGRSRAYIGNANDSRPCTPEAGTHVSYRDRDIFVHKQTIADGLLQAVTAVCTPGDLHHVENIAHPSLCTSLWKGTPLVSLIGGIVFGLILETSRGFYSWRQFNRAQQGAITLRIQKKLLQKALQAYICGLQAARVDLTAYGHKEHTILHNDLDALRGNFDADSLLMRESLFSPFSKLGGAVVPFSIVDLEFGAEPEQWRLIWEPELEVMARQFWETIEPAPLLMPGSWVE
ncbi:hypothetical protein LIA77_06492 [Sarocladium implicatum]|nr:hypothetical protein LIA77_06492 [Sarocladium implicatum]